jgi:hypothetical protein
MDAFGLPMSFGKKAKVGPVNIKAKVDKTKRDDVSLLPLLYRDLRKSIRLSDVGTSCSQTRAQGITRAGHLCADCTGRSSG